MFTLASAGCAGVNMETGVNQLGFVSHYSPIGDDEHGHYGASPEYYGMLAFAQAGVGRIVGCSMDALEKNVSAYATQPDSKHLVLTIINKEPLYDANLVLKRETSPSVKSAQLVRLSAPRLESKSGVTLGDAAVSATGAWRSTSGKPVAIHNAGLKLNVPRASALIASLSF